MARSVNKNRTIPAVRTRGVIYGWNKDHTVLNWTVKSNFTRDFSESLNCTNGFRRANSFIHTRIEPLSFSPVSGVFKASDGSGLWELSNSPPPFGSLIGTGFSPQVIPIPSEADLIKKAIAPYISDLAVSLAELREITELCHGVLKTLTLQSSFSETVLNYQLAIRPLINDIKSFAFAAYNWHTAYESLRKKLANPLKLSERLNDKGFHVNRVEDSLSINTVECDWVSTSVWTVRATFTLPPSPLEPLFRNLFSVAGSPSISTVWDLVPFSFVVDWFFPIGDLLDDYALNPLGIVLKSADGTVSSKLVTELKYSTTVKYFTGRPSFEGWYSERNLAYNRSVFDAVGLFQSGINSFNLNLSQLVTGTALVTSVSGVESKLAKLIGLKKAKKA